MKTLPFIAVAALLAGPVAAKEKVKFDTVELEDGTVLKEAVVTKVEPDGLRLEHSAGINKVKFENLPESVRNQFAFDREEAARFRAEQDAAKSAREASERKVRVTAVLEQRRTEQESDVQKGREAFFKLLESGEYSYPQLDKSLVDSIAILKEADRDDLATMLEDDRKMLRERELLKPADKYRAERDQLLARIRDLENQVAQLNGGKVPANIPANNNQIDRDERDLEIIPVYVDRPVIINRPVPVDRSGTNPCPPARSPRTPGSTPARIIAPAIPAAPVTPARNFQPAVPFLPQPSAPSFTPARPSLPASPAPHAVPSTPVSLPSGGAQQQGAHLWNR